jgi:hypothetical protein
MCATPSTPYSGDVLLFLGPVCLPLSRPFNALGPYHLREIGSLADVPTPVDYLGYPASSRGRSPAERRTFSYGVVGSNPAVRASTIVRLK